MLNVAIAVDSATDLGADAAGVVAAACEEVIGRGRCPLASAIAPGTVTAWHARVHPNDGALSSVRIELRDRTADGVMIEERSLVFGPRDSLKSRLASAGSVIAAMAAAREGTLVPVPAKDVVERAPVPVDRPEKEPDPIDLAFELAALAAPAVGSGPLRLGGGLGAHFGFARRPFVSISARYALHDGDASFYWSTFSGGLGTRLFDRASRFNVEASVEFVFEHTVVAAERAGARESASADGLGGRLRLGATWQAWNHVSIVAAVDGTAILPRVNVVVGDEPATRIPPVTLAFSLGLRLQP